MSKIEKFLLLLFIYFLGLYFTTRLWMAMQGHFEGDVFTSILITVILIVGGLFVSIGKNP